MPSFLQSKDLNIKGFISLVQQYRFPEGSLIMAFSPARAVFEIFNMDESFLAATDQGRIFSPAGELKWRRIDAGMRAVYLGTQVPPGGLNDCSSEMKGLNPKLAEYVLWGERTNIKDEWIEQQVPHRFVYPVSGKEYPYGRVALVVENWHDSTEFIRFSRYHNIKEIPGET